MDIQNSRILTLAKNKKQKEINNILILRDEMLANNINEKLIKEFVDEQYKIINDKYQKKINKINTKEKEQDKQIKKKREKALNLLLKNKSFLELTNVNKKYINNYAEKQYNEINKKYIIEKNSRLCNVNFI